MSDIATKAQSLPRATASDRLRAFEVAIEDFSTVRTQLTSLGIVIAMQDGDPDDVQAERLKELSAEHFMAGEKVKAIAMTLLSEGLLTRCTELIRMHGEGLR